MGFVYDLRCLLGDLILFCLGMNFSSGVLGDVVFRSCLLGDVDSGTSFVWGFAWGGFAWVCETGVFAACCYHVIISSLSF